MLSSKSAHEPTLDLSSCAREPIHTPGAIQPYGLLLVIDPSDLHVVERAVSDPSLLERLGEPLGCAASAVFSGVLAPSCSLLSTLEPGASIFLGTFTLGEYGACPTLAHRSERDILVEFEAPVVDQPGALEDFYPSIRQFIEAIEKSTTPIELCEVAAAHVRELTGFDRTLIYKFDKEWNGIVLAEDRNHLMPSYLDLRFPESDIPAQARELYRRNRVRLIANNAYVPVPLVAASGQARTGATDLSLAVLRSVSPVHLQYMRNMGTGASLSISIVCEGRLWGLISCHNHDAKRVSYPVRTACEFIGQIFSLQVSLKERALKVEERVSRRAIQVQLLGRMAGDENFMAALGRHPQSLLALTHSSGAAIVHRDECVLLGECPTQPQVLKLVQWLTAHQGSDDLFHTDRLPALWEEADAFSDVASGVLSLSISQLHDSFVLWFRPEVVRTVRWGGDPRKKASGQVLSPRMSFEAWKETVHKQALPWDDVDQDAAMELRVAIVDIVLRKAEEMAELNEQLIRSNKELEAFSYSVSHDLRAPFRHIVGYSELLGSSAGERLTETERRFLATIVESAKSAGTLVDDLLSFSQMGRSTLGRLTIDMRVLIDDVRNKLEMEYRGRSIEWILPNLPKVDADPTMLRLVWQNLLANAIKFTRDSVAPRIEIGHERTIDEDIFFVRDNGCGFDMRYVDKLFGVFQRLHHSDEYEGTGIGLANVRRIVSRHGGRTWAEGETGKGATVYFTIPFFLGGSS
ncbi:ATPase [Xanthomonas arboricola]|uniref:ATP-binding protein n=1 Tax=Xanthomonas arboricola TaxID=56448 RepID=UPI00061A390C|nr:ATP-binding protein [Xanthomonas arboricola]AKC80599.1 ATPase [Xanthomonas arboricola]